MIWMLSLRPYVRFYFIWKHFIITKHLPCCLIAPNFSVIKSYKWTCVMIQHVNRFAENNQTVFTTFCFQFSVNDKVVVSRSCSWEDINAPADSCMRTSTPSYIKTEFCETCGHDGELIVFFLQLTVCIISLNLKNKQLEFLISLKVFQYIHLLQDLLQVNTNYKCTLQVTMEYFRFAFPNEIQKYSKYSWCALEIQNNWLFFIIFIINRLQRCI